MILHVVSIFCRFCPFSLPVRIEDSPRFSGGKYSISMHTRIPRESNEPNKPKEPKEPRKAREWGLHPWRGWRGQPRGNRPRHRSAPLRRPTRKGSYRLRRSETRTTYRARARMFCFESAGRGAAGVETTPPEPSFGRVAVTTALACGAICATAGCGTGERFAALSGVSSIFGKTL